VKLTLVFSMLLLVWTVSGLGTASATAAEFDATKMVGTWTFVSSERGGEKAGQDRLKSKVVLTKDVLTIKGEDGQFVMKYKLDTSQDPVSIEMTISESPFGAGATAKGIVDFKDNLLRICYDDQGGKAPEEFASPAGSVQRLIVLKRASE
jgi:uncharacterized protein (TIGR03067 family)